MDESNGPEAQFKRPWNPGPELWAALAAFQATKPTAKLDAVNPHFKSKYATLAAVTAVVAKASKFGLSHSQLVQPYTVITVVAHASGQVISAETPIIAPKDTAHSYGAGVTYARRFALSAIFGVAADDDDDGNAAVEATRKAKHSKDFKAGDMKWIFPRLKELGLTMEEVNRYRNHYNRGNLSALRKEKASDFLMELDRQDSETRRHFDAWRNENG